MAFASLHQEVSALTQKLGLSSELAMLDYAWEKEMGALKNLVSIAAIDRGTLVLEAGSHTALQEVMLRRRELARKLNKHFSSPIIQNITVRIAQNHGH